MYMTTSHHYLFLIYYQRISVGNKLKLIDGFDFNLRKIIVNFNT